MKLSHFLGLGLILLTACAKGTSENKLVLTGSSTVAPLASELAKDYEGKYPNVRIDVQTGGSSRGMADARANVADIGMVSRALKPEESDLTPYTIAQDGLTMIVNSENPVQSLTNQEIIDIYTDKINNWKEVGGKDAPITVVNKAEGRSTLELFVDYFSLESPNIVADVIIGDNEQGIKTVAGNPNAIGYVSIGAGEYSRDNNIPVVLLPMKGIEASTENVRNGTFPLSRQLNFVTLGQPSSDLAQDFIDFAQSSEVHDTIEEQYLVPISE